MEPFSTTEAAASYVPDLRVGSLLKRAWPIYKEHLGTIVGATLLYMLIFGVLSGGDFLGLGAGAVLSGNLLVLILSGPLTVGLYSVMLRLVRGEQVSVTSMFDGFQHFGRALGVYLLMGLATIVGLILLIVPGIIVAVGLWPAPYLVFDEEQGVVATLERAWEITRGYKFQLFVVAMVLLLIVVLGLVALFVGIIFTAAYAYVVSALAYEELSLAGS
jgi:uncharacterized membrane protein